MVPRNRSNTQHQHVQSQRWLLGTGKCEIPQLHSHPLSRFSNSPVFYQTQKCFTLYVLLVLNTISQVNNLASRSKEPAVYLQASNKTSRVPNTYSVILRTEYTKEEHFNFIDRNLELKNTMFERLSTINAHTAHIDSHTIQNLICYDLGVLSAEDDVFLDFTLTFGNGEDYEIPTVEPSKFKKRYAKGTELRCAWWNTMIQAGKKLADVPDFQECV